MAVQTFTKTGTKSTVAAKVDKTIFGLEVANHELLKQAYLAYLANARGADAVTKTRGLVRGGGRKPWRQKGTGRARFGSSRNPIWRGGGITFGPTGEQNYTQKLPTAMKRQALRQALSLTAKEGRLSVIENFDFKDGRVKSAVKIIDKINPKGQVLLVAKDKDPMVERATRNLPNVKTAQASYLTVFDLLNADSVVISQPALEVVTSWLKPAKGAKNV